MSSAVGVRNMCRMWTYSDGWMSMVTPSERNSLSGVAPHAIVYTVVRLRETQRRVVTVSSGGVALTRTYAEG